MIVTFKITCKDKFDTFNEVDVEKNKVIFQNMFQPDDVIDFDIDVKLGEPLKGGEKECNVISIARHLKS